MCATDFDYELGKAAGGIEVYASQGDLIRHRDCVSWECGIYRVRVEVIEVIKESEI